MDMYLLINMILISWSSAFLSINDSISHKNDHLPNIIIFVADDANWNDFGPYGNDVIHTPTINKLAEEGLTVNKAFLMVGQCSPSRISILTGMYPHTSGAEELHMHLPEHLKMMPSYLQERGYFTGHMKKTHYGPHGDQQFNWYSEKTADSFPEFLNEAEGQPFFLWVVFYRQHRPYPGWPFVVQVYIPESVQVPHYMMLHNIIILDVSDSLIQTGHIRAALMSSSLMNPWNFMFRINLLTMKQHEKI